MITIQVSGLDDLKVKLLALQSLDVDEILDEVEALLLNRIRTRFLAEQDPSGSPWKPSHAGMVRRRGGYTYRNGKPYTGTGTLFETGALFHSIQAHPLGASERAISTDVPYANYVQPPWLFLGFGEEDVSLAERRVLQLVSDALT